MTLTGNFGTEASEEWSRKKMTPRICSEENEEHNTSIYF